MDITPDFDLENLNADAFTDGFSFNDFLKVLSAFGDKNGLLPEQVPVISEAEFTEMMAIFASLKTEEEGERLQERIELYVSDVISGVEPTFIFRNFIDCIRG